MPSTQSGREFVSYALFIGALELIPEGRKLKSGRLSPYFFNAGLFYTAEATDHLAMSYASTIARADENDELVPDVIFGPAYKGIAIAVSTASMLRFEFVGYDKIAWAHDRKEEKDHGDGGVLVGAPLTEKRVIIVDDVITDGASKRGAVDCIRGAGGEPVACVIAFDRQERGADPSDPRPSAARFSEEFEIPVLAAATLEDLIQVLEEGPDFPKAAKTLPLILKYRDQYGVG